MLLSYIKQTIIVHVCIQMYGQYSGTNWYKKLTRPTINFKTHLIWGRVTLGMVTVRGRNRSSMRELDFRVLTRLQTTRLHYIRCFSGVGCRCRISWCRCRVGDCRCGVGGCRVGTRQGISYWTDGLGGGRGGDFHIARKSMTKTPRIDRVNRPTDNASSLIQLQRVGTLRVGGFRFGVGGCW